MMTKENTGIQSVKSNPAHSEPEEVAVSVGSGGEWHQTANSDQPALTTNQGLPISDNQKNNGVIKITGSGLGCRNTANLNVF